MKSNAEIASRQRKVFGAGLVLGLGLGGFIDGILFHQLLQWHHVICYTCSPEATVAEVRENIFWDGVFHAFTFALTVTGAFLVWRAARGAADIPTRVLIGAILAGWGVFNLAEGSLNHHVLGLHHVRPGPSESTWDLAFLVFGAGLIVVGWLLSRLTPAPETRTSVSDRIAT